MEVQRASLRPAGLRISAALFGVPAVIVLLMVWVTIPLLDAWGVPLWLNVPAQFVAFMAGLGTAGVVGWRRAGIQGGRELAAAMRLSPLRLSHCLWSAPVVLIGVWA